MKANFIRVIFSRVSFLVLFSLHFLLVFGQPDYTFQGGTLISGTANQVGAVYKFTNVRAGVDATVEIKFISPGISVVELDGTSGYMEALQPTLNAQANKSGHLEMLFKLLVAGTSTPYTASEMPVTCIDVDGVLNNDGSGHPLHEYDEVDLGGGYADFSTLGGEITISQSGPKFKGKNIGGIDYPGRDTSAKAVMFSVVNTNVSTFTIKVGVDNQSNISSERLRSVYFKKFIYPGSILASSYLHSFKGKSQSGKIDLDWTLTTDNTISEIELQRSFTGADFSTIASFFNNIDGISKSKFNYTDLQATADVYYQLKLKNAAGKIEYSTILSFRKTGNRVDIKAKVYPSIVTGKQFCVSVNAIAREESLLLMTDYSGRIVYQKKIELQQGNNTVLINDFNSSLKGGFVVVTKTSTGSSSSKIFFQ